MKKSRMVGDCMNRAVTTIDTGRRTVYGKVIVQWKQMAIAIAAALAAAMANGQGNNLDELLKRREVVKPVDTRDLFFSEFRAILMKDMSIGSGRGFLRGYGGRFYFVLEDSYGFDKKRNCMRGYLDAVDDMLEINFGGHAELSRVNLQITVDSMNPGCGIDGQNGGRRFLEDVLQLFEEVKTEHLKQVRAAAAQREQTAATSQHIRNRRAEMLRSGKVPVSSIQDAALQKGALSGTALVMSPTVKADLKSYLVNGTLVDWDGDVLTGRWGSASFAVMLSPKTKFLDGAQDQLRLNYPFSVVGRFVTTTPIANRIGVVFSADYISVP
jgi:hypothetical protein